MPDRAPFFGIVAAIGGYYLADTKRWLGHPAAWAGLLGFGVFAAAVQIQRGRGTLAAPQSATL